MNKKKRRFKPFDTNALFRDLFVPWKGPGAHFALLVGGKPREGLVTVDVDGVPTQAVKVSFRWRRQLLKGNHSPKSAYALLRQMLPDGEIRATWPTLWYAWQHANARKAVRRELAQAGALRASNPYHTGSVRGFAHMSIV